MASLGTRRRTAAAPIAKKQFDTVTIANADGTGTITTSMANINMLIERMDILINNMTNAVTTTITIADENDVDIFDGTTFATLARNTNHTFLSTKATPDFAAVPINNTLTLSVTLSGACGATGAEIQVILYGP